MTEYDYSPEAYDRYMATQTRISNWVDNVTQSTQMSTPTTPQPPPDHYQPRSRPSYSQPHSQTHSRSNSASRSHSRERPHYHHREHSSYRPRSHSQSSSRPQAIRSYTFAQPTHSRTYSYALHHPPPPMPIPFPPPVPHLHPVPRRSRTLPNQQHQVVYHTYEAPRGGPTYVMGQPAVGHVPPQIRMQNAVTPTKRSQPLLKRLFTSFGPWGSSSSGPSPKSKHPPTRRHRRRSSF